MLFEETVLWQSGDEGLESFYIYGLIKTGSSLHVFAEGRIERHDRSPHHIVYRRSLDNGFTWWPTSYVIKSENGECYSNPVPVFDAQRDRIVLLYSLNIENDRSHLFAVTSDDDGGTWSTANELTQLFENDAYARTLHLPGPGHGIRLKSGRLIFPIWHRRSLKFPPLERKYGISFIYSDNGGETFQNAGEISPAAEMINESRMIELVNGRLLLNARSGAFTVSPRYSSFSNDSGFTWSKPERVHMPHDSFATDSSFIKLSDDRLLFIRPDACDRREDLTAYISDDAGITWSRKRHLYKGIAGYSDAALLNDGTIGVVYGRGALIENGDVEGNVRFTVFARFDTDWLMEKTNE